MPPLNPPVTPPVSPPATPLGKRLATLALLGAVLVSAGCQDVRSFFSPRRLKADVEAMEDPIFPDERRTGIAGIQRRPELTQDIYQERFRQIARVDPAPSVRAQAARALNQGRDELAKPIFRVSLLDPDPKVRLEAAKALRNVPDEQAVPRLIALAADQNQDRDVRIWSTAALGSYPRIEVARALVPLLNDREFAVSYEARMSLKRLTRKDYHYEEGTWLKYLTTAGAPFPDTTLTTRPVVKPSGRRLGIF